LNGGGKMKVAGNENEVDASELSSDVESDVVY
jgi:hypothetical protein